eukprot:TRINITY_DN11630_c0_g1_i1.p1 TRINITY_DN11630_c0_g1~~TRINITY_DN11630_c0_g1_i1.p1  ORF type:complete len:387 (+),score=94.06 TRINITY_DN11630_c0_g1_i1:382-1542(+)
MSILVPQPTEFPEDTLGADPMMNTDEFRTVEAKTEAVQKPAAPDAWLQEYEVPAGEERRENIAAAMEFAKKRKEVEQKLNVKTADVSVQYEPPMSRRRWKWFNRAKQWVQRGDEAHDTARNDLPGNDEQQKRPQEQTETPAVPNDRLTQALRFVGVPDARMSVVRTEINRKRMHVMILSCPPLLYHLGLKFMLFTQRTTAIAVAVVSLIYIALDYARLRVPAIENFTERHFGYILRRQEKTNRPTGLTYFLIGYLLSVILYSPIVANTATWFTVLGDTFAALIGRAFGKAAFQPFGLQKKKTAMGTFAMFMTCFMVAFAWYANSCVGWSKGFDMAFYGALMGTASELMPMLDDNLFIPLASGAAMQFTAWRLHIDGACLWPAPVQL